MHHVSTSHPREIHVLGNMAHFVPIVTQESHMVHIMITCVELYPHDKMNPRGIVNDDNEKKIDFS